MANKYLDEMNRLLMQSFEENYAKYQALSDREKHLAKLNRDEALRSSSISYQNMINPYSTNAESLAMRGLSDSGIMGSNYARLYGSYQNNVAVANDAYNNSLNDISASLLSERSNVNAKKMAQMAQYYQQLYDDHWAREKFDYEKENDLKNYDFNQAKFDYEKSRDKISDERWQEEFDFRKASAMLKNVSSARRSTSSGGSSKTKKEVKTETDENQVTISPISGRPLQFKNPLNDDDALTKIWKMISDATSKKDAQWILDFAKRRKVSTSDYVDIFAMLQYKNLVK